MKMIEIKNRYDGNTDNLQPSRTGSVWLNKDLIRSVGIATVKAADGTKLTYIAMNGGYQTIFYYTSLSVDKIIKLLND